jgi:outer membrane lipoprotein-sorting protein
MKTLVTLLAVATVFLIVGCSKQGEEGKAEKAGKQVDQAMEKAQTYTGEKMKEMGQAFERTGDDLKKKQ